MGRVGSVRNVLLFRHTDTSSRTNSTAISPHPSPGGCGWIMTLVRLKTRRSVPRPHPVEESANHLSSI